MSSATQQAFTEQYITTSGIMRFCGVTRTAVFAARKLGKLPDPILIEGQIYIWERAKVQEYLNAWRTIAEARRAAKQNTQRTFMAQ